MNTPRPTSHSEPKTPWLPWMTLAVFWALAVSLQWLNGAYQSDLGAHSDEPAHVVTGLMVRDYVAGPLWRGDSPVAFAKDYYERFPKVALGHYPPAFYVLEALWLLPCRTLPMVLAFCALVTAVTAWLMFRVGKALLGQEIAVALAVAFILYRVVQTYTATVMADVMLTGTCLGAAMAWERFLTTRRGWWSLAFGGIAAAAILTKASGILLALLPVFSIALRRDWKLVYDKRLWLAPLPVAALAVPWMIATVKISSEGHTGLSVTSYFLKAVSFYSGQTIEVFGWATTALLITGAVMLGRKIVLRRSPESLETTLWSLLLAAFVLILLVPVGFEDRYLLPALPPAILLGAHSARNLWSSLSNLPLPRTGWQHWATGAILFLLLVGTRLNAPDKRITGYSQVIDELALQTESTGRVIRILACSDTHGEGALVAAAALRTPKDISVQRGSKLLSTSDWMGRGYKLAFDSPESLHQLLLESDSQFAVLDGVVPEERKFLHQRKVEEFVNLPGLSMSAVNDFSARRRDRTGSLRLFRITAERNSKPSPASTLDGS